jgi:glutamyl-tRNA synthetase
MSKRDKAKAARAALRESGRDPNQLAAEIGIDAETMTRFRKKKNDDVAIAQAIAGALGVALPEIDVVDFRRAGYLPEALVNFLALLGWSPGDDREIMGFDEMVDAFTLDRVGRTAARFDRDKLRWMNGMYIRQSSDERLYVLLRAWLDEGDHPVKAADEATLRGLIPLFKERSTTLYELAEKARFLFEAPTHWGPAKAIRKHLLKGGGLASLARVHETLTSLQDWSEAGLETCLRSVVENELEGKLGRMAQPLRIAITGTPVSPPIFATVAQLGRTETLARIETCLAHHEPGVQ